MRGCMRIVGITRMATRAMRWRQRMLECGRLGVSNRIVRAQGVRMTKAELLRELAELVTRRQPVPLARYFTEDFRLDDAGAGVVRTGHAGAQTMLSEILALAPDVRLDVLDTVEGAEGGADRL